MRDRGRIAVVGADTMVGRALLERLTLRGYAAEPEPPETRGNPGQLATAWRRERPDCVFLAAGKSGGISANQRFPADLMRDNLRWELETLEAAHESGVQRLFYIASSCCYPRDCPQPMRPEHLLTGALEPTNEPYALAKLAGVKLCEAYGRQFAREFTAVIPANLYGPGDDFDPEASHVIPGLLRRFHDGKLQGVSVVDIWGTGAAVRDFLFVDDLADACAALLDRNKERVVNVGSGEGVSIAVLAGAVADVVGYRGSTRFDASRPDGMPRKVLDTSSIQALGWEPRMSLRDGIAATYSWFLDAQSKVSTVENKVTGGAGA